KEPVTRDACVVHHDVGIAVLLAHLGEGLHGGIPVRDVAHRGMEGESGLLLLVDPLVVVTARAAPGDDEIPFPGEPLADGSADAAHAPGHIRDPLNHLVLLRQSMLLPGSRPSVSRSTTRAAYAADRAMSCLDSTYSAGSFT